LCRLGNKTAVEAHLFDEFIPIAYQAGTVGRWTGDDAGRWLIFLARHLEVTIGRSDLAWWEPQHSAPDAVSRIARRISRGLVFGRFSVAVLGLVAAFLDL
jgi:hypothetical protein